MQGCFGGGHPLNKVKIDKSGAEYNKNKLWRPPGIEEDRCKKGKIVLEFTGQEVIDQQEGREEIKYENAAAEYHYGSIMIGF